MTIAKAYKHCEECDSEGTIQIRVRGPEESVLVESGCPACCEHEEKDNDFCLDCGIHLPWLSRKFYV